MVYLYLVIAIVAETIGTSALKATEQFTKLIPSLIVVVCYGISFYLLTLVLKTMQVGVAYAIWTSIGIILVTVYAAVWYKEMPDLPAIIGMALIMAGVIVINLFSKSVGH